MALVFRFAVLAPRRLGNVLTFVGQRAGWVSERSPHERQRYAGLHPEGMSAFQPTKSGVLPDIASLIRSTLAERRLEKAKPIPWPMNCAVIPEYRFAHPGYTCWRRLGYHGEWSKAAR
jgi:hypothetical protein